MPLDPHVARLLGALALAPARVTRDPQARREGFRSLMRLSGAGAPVGKVEQAVMPGPAQPLTMRVYTPLGAGAAALPGLIFLHGGGFVCGDLETHDALCRTMCQASGCRLVALEYRLAPEHRFPAAVQDARAASLWVIENAALLGLDRARIAIAGDSAGATLAAVVCQTLALTHPGALALQLLLCPILDWAADAAARRGQGPAQVIDADTMAEELAHYLPPGQDARHPHVSPLRTGCERQWRGQPPAHIHTAEFDPTQADGHAYAERLRKAAVAVRHVHHAGMVHLFYGFGRLLPYAAAALRQIGNDVAAALA